MMRWWRTKQTNPEAAAPPSPSVSGSNDVVDLQWLLLTYIKWSWVAVLFALIGAYTGVQGARNPSLSYVAKMIVAPESGSTELSGAGSALSSVLGVELTQNAGAIDRMQVMVGSMKLASNLQEKYGLLQRVFSGGWDAATKEWKKPTGKAFQRSERVRHFFGLPAWSPPDLQSLAGYVGGAINFENNTGGGFVTVTVLHPDPEFALFLLRTVYREADDLLREQDLVASRERRNYIYGKLGEARLLDSRQALISLVTSEERKAMLLESELPYSARTMEEPFVSSRPVEPNVRSKIIFSTLIGGLLGFGLITMVALFRRPS